MCQPVSTGGIRGIPRFSTFFDALYNYIEQDNLYKSSNPNGVLDTDCWGNNNHNKIVPILQCPSDSSSSNGICVSGASGWAASSYAPVWNLFGNTRTVTSLPPPGGGWYKTHSTFNIGNIPDGTSNQIGIVERFGSFPAYGWSNAAVWPQDNAHWGWNQYGAVYGPWGLYIPQTSARPTGTNPAHPFYPNSGHPVCMILLMDGSTRSVSSSITQTTWSRVCQPSDGNVLGNDW
jgi:hypothetical protein